MNVAGLATLLGVFYTPIYITILSAVFYGGKNGTHTSLDKDLHFLTNQATGIFPYACVPPL